MSNVLSEAKKQQVIALGRLGWPLRRIEQETGVRRETAGAYLKAAGIGVRPPGAWGRRPPAKPANRVTTGSDVAKPANPNTKTNTENLPNKVEAKAKPANAAEVTTGFGVELSASEHQPPQPVPSTSFCEPFREAIELGLSRERNAMAIWQDLVSESGFSGGYQTVKRFVRKLRGNQPAQPRAVIVTAPGEEAQVDYGTGPMVRDPQTSKYRRTRLFVLTLGCSRKAVRLLSFRSSSRIWAELHEKAFRRLGGCTRVVVLDNLREGVLVPDIYDPTLNPLYRDVLTHYGSVALPCRIKDPDRKGKVERGVGHAKNTPLKGKRFESLEEAQAYLDHWETRCADTRIHGTTKRQVATMFAEEKPFLLPLPLEPFRYYQHGQRVVHLDGCVEVEAAYYGLPPGWIGRLVQVQWDVRCCGSMYARNAAGIALKKRTTRNRDRCVSPSCCGEPAAPVLTSAHSATLFITNSANPASAASWASLRWPRNSAQPQSRMLARSPSKWACMSSASFVAISNVVPN